jgi:Sulfotransferase domain
MARTFDIKAIHAAFTLPNSDGSFDPDFHHYLQELGEKRPTVILAFAPKTAGTYLRTAAIVAVRGSLVRTVHAQGGRDATFYLPTFLTYYADQMPATTLVTHVHMQALPANRHFIEALDLKPIVMLRDIADMLASYLDMLETEPLAGHNWLNIALPCDYAARSGAAKADFIIDMMGPWYASYYATWISYAAEKPGRVLLLSFNDFLADPGGTLEKLLVHSRVGRSRVQCDAALAQVWEERESFRFNKGITRRGQMRFSIAQLERLRQQIAYYPALTAMQDLLVAPS